MAVGFANRGAALVVVLVAALLPRVTGAANCTIDCVGLACTCSGSGVCTVVSREEVDPGSVIDCTGRDIVVAGSIGLIEVVDGAFVLRAHNLTINGQRFIRAKRSKANGIPFGMTIDLTGRLDAQGYLSVDGPGGGGSISVETDQDLLITRSGGDGINASGTTTNSPGGRVNLVSGANVVIGDPILARAAAGTASGGTVEVTAVGDITVSQSINVLGRKVQAGSIMLSAQGHVDLRQWLKAEGWGLNGDGGEVTLAGRRVTIGAPISAQGGVDVTGGESHGGALVVEAGVDGVAINADVYVMGGAQGAGLDGGAIVVDSEGPVTVANTVRLTTRSGTNGGNGGDVRLFSLDRLTLNATTLDVRGHSAGNGEGSGATVELEGCVVKLAPGAVIDARGFNGGSVTLIGREALTVNGTVDTTASGGEAGLIGLAYRLPGACGGTLQIGCEPGQCLSTGACRHDPAASCAADADCRPCGTQQCLDNPNLAGARFRGATAELEENRSLESCD